MTYDTGGYSPPTTTGSDLDTGDTLGTGAVLETEDSGGRATTDVAKDKAAEVKDTAKQAGANVAASAGEQAKNVAGETKQQARNLLGETQSQVKEQAGSQKQKAAESLRSVSDELRSMSESSDQSGVVGDLARQAADKADDLARWLDDREPAQLLDDLRDLARRKPGAFLLGAALAGVVAGRLTRGVVDVKREDSEGSGGDSYPSYSGGAVSSSYATDAPAASSWTETSGYATDPAPDTGGAVVVESDPFGTNPTRSTLGGDRL